jgi:hypothetical protein
MNWPSGLDLFRPAGVIVHGLGGHGYEEQSLLACDRLADLVLSGETHLPVNPNSGSALFQYFG